MAEVTNDLLYEVLKAVQARQAGMDGKLDELKQEMQAFRTQLVGVRQEIIGLHQEISAIHATLVRHEHPLDRIERRLQLTDAPAS
jgi:septal ring factor EnvC (AmiA/AmiB activator)